MLRAAIDPMGVLETRDRADDRLPPDAFKVSESGIAGADDIDLLSGAGYDAFLIGESLLLAEDPAEKLRELV